MSDDNDTKVSKPLTKEEFDTQCQALLAISKQNLERFEAVTVNSPAWRTEIDRLASRDPQLAELVKEADVGMISHLRTLVRYIAKRVEN